MACYIKTGISDYRQADGQPETELIAFDSHVKIQELSDFEFIETTRFGDWKEEGGNSVRYYHLNNECHGAALCLEEGNSGKGRILLGFYEDRVYENNQDSAIYDLKEEREMDSNLSIEDALKSANYIRHEVNGGGILSTKINCVEFFDDQVRVLSSIRIPNCLLKGDESAVGLKKFLDDKAKESIKNLRNSKSDVFNISNNRFIDIRATYVHKPNTENKRLFITINGSTTIRYKTTSSILGR